MADIILEGKNAAIKEVTKMVAKNEVDDELISEEVESTNEVT